MKRVALLLILTLLMSLCACGGEPAAPSPASDSSDSDRNDPVYSDEAADSNAFADYEGSPFDIFKPDGTDTAETPASPDTAEASQDDNRITLFWDILGAPSSGNRFVISDATSFSDGVAWVTVDEEILSQSDSTTSVTTGERTTFLINTYGEPLFEITEDYPRYTNFSHGVSLVDDGNDAYLINNSGEVVWSVSENGWSEATRLYGEGNVERIELDCSTYTPNSNFTEFDYYNTGIATDRFNGYTAVLMHVNTFDKTGDLCGILNPDGTWLLEPIDGAINLRADDCFAFWKSQEDENIYAIRLETGEIVNCGKDSWYEIYNMDDDVEDWHPEAQIVWQWQDEYNRAHQDNLIYDQARRGFTDERGNVVVDLSEYTLLNDCFPVYKNGYCFLAVKNPDGAPYFTVIDTNGNRVFEPVKYPSFAKTSTDYCAFVVNDRFVLTKAIYAEYYAFTFGTYQDGYYFDLSGQELPWSYNTIYPYSDDLALVKTDAFNYSFIDLDGNEVFTIDSERMTVQEKEAAEQQKAAAATAAAAEPVPSSEPPSDDPQSSGGGSSGTSLSELNFEDFNATGDFNGDGSLESVNELEYLRTSSLPHNFIYYDPEYDATVEGAICTDRGIHIYDTLNDVEAVYGEGSRSDVDPQDTYVKNYVPDATYIITYTDSADHAFIRFYFDADNQVVGVYYGLDED
ncbi:MAG: hypothetical protein IJ206_05785 [Oscillospiraceae bacterium]|nr:hypothetical protein [Oscillospiraceae bacterium]